MKRRFYVPDDLESDEDREDEHSHMAEEVAARAGRFRRDDEGQAEHDQADDGEQPGADAGAFVVAVAGRRFGGGSGSAPGRNAGFGRWRLFFDRRGPEHFAFVENNGSANDFVVEVDVQADAGSSG